MQQRRHAPRQSQEPEAGYDPLRDAGLLSQNQLGNQEMLARMKAQQAGTSAADEPGEVEASIRTGIGSHTPGVRASADRYTVVAGDTLSGIARRAGQPDWQELYNLNRDHIMDANALEVGQVLVLPEGWTVPGMVSDPNNLIGDPLALANTEYVDPSLELGVQVNADGSTTQMEGLTQGAIVEGARTVRVVRGSGDPIERTDGTAPAEAELFVEDPAGAAVQRTQGSIAAPTTWRWPVAGSMFVGGGPVAADIRQGGIGDCFYQADLLGIVNQDPGQIDEMMDYSDDRVSVGFFRKDAAGLWVSTNVTVTNDLMVTSSDTADLRGADVRVAEAPQETGWYADLMGDTLEISRNEHYEWALWAPMLEKAYARFAKQYGPYGDAAAQAPTGDSGYKQIDGGFARKVFPVFYGSEADQMDATPMQYDPDANSVITNITALEQLVQLQEQQGRPGAAGGEQTFLSVKIGDDDAIKRCGALVTAALRDHWEWPWNTDALTPDLQALQATITTWSAAKNVPNRDAVIAAATSLSAPGTHPELVEEGSPRSLRDLNEVLGTVINIGSDNSPGRRMVYSSHQYNVESVSWAFWMGLPVPISSSNVAIVAPMIDPMASSVMLQNPHARNEPDLDGDGPDLDPVNEGRFAMSLDQLFRNFSWFETTVIDHEPTP